MMNKVVLGLVIVAVLISGTALYQSNHSVKIAYIRSADMVYSYEGMKDAQKAYQDKMLAWQANVDTLRIELERNFNTYTNESTKLSVKEKSEKESLLSQQQQNYNQYAQAIKAKSKTEEQKMTEGVLNQVNSFIEEYSKKQGYDVVIGTTTSGNLLYAKQYMDITEDVLKALNENYHSPVEKSLN
ncbi:MAG: OmpH family outer membrane protein [Bacteroidota bacterium]|nr:OmpH family outer membrane protein [Bacteroidota bacterium]